MNSPPSNTSSTRKRRITTKVAWVLCAGLLLYLAIGFFAVPAIVRAVADSQVDEHLHARLEMDSVSFNPLTLRLHLEGVSLRDFDENEVLRLGDGRFRLSLSSLVEFSPVLAEVLLDEPGVLIKRNAEGEINWLGLLKETEKDPDADVPKLTIRRLEISRGEMEFSDEGLAEPLAFTFSPISFELDDFTTFREEGNRFRFSASDSHGGKVRGDGDITVEPATATIELGLEDFQLSAFAAYVREHADVELRDGTLDLQLSAAFRADSEEEMITGNLRSLVVSDFGLSPLDVEVPFLTVGQIHVANADFGAWDPRVNIESVRISEGRAHVRRLEDGSIDWIQMLLPNRMETDPPADEPGAPLSLAFSVDSVGMERFEFEVEDLATGGDARLEGVLYEAGFRSITEDLGNPVPFSLEGELLGAGRFRIAGDLTPDPLSGEIDVLVEELPLAPFDPWGATFVDLSIASGSAGVNGNVSFVEGAGELPELSFAGSARIENFEAREGEETVLQFGHLDLDELELQSEPLSFRGGLIRLERPNGLVVMEEDGNLNLLRVLRMTDTTDSANASGPADEPTNEIPLDYAVAAIEVAHGQVALADRTITPHYATRIEEIDLRILDLQSDPNSRATVNGSARFSDASRVEISGTTNAHPAQLFADLSIQMTGFGLPPVSPYSGKFIGRSISSGDLDVNVSATVENDRLSAQTGILLKDLRLGEPIEDSDAPRLPLDMALALLRNRDGEISIDLPVSGDTDDPEFRVAAVATDALFTVIRNIASSPFSALANLVGTGSEQLSRVDFRPGEFVLSSDQENAVRTLAEALRQRPALRLDARGVADPVADRPVLKEKLLIEELAAHRSAMGGETDAMHDDPSNDPDLVRSLYETRFGPLDVKPEPAEELPEVPEEEETEFVSTDADTEGETDTETESTLERESGERSWIGVKIFGRTVWPRPDSAEGPESETAREEEPAADEPEIAEVTEAPEEIEEPEPEVEIPSLTEMKNRLLESIEVTDEAFVDLARSRAEAVRAALLETGFVEEDRIAIGETALETGPRVEFEVQSCASQ